MADPASTTGTFDPKAGWAGAMGLEFPSYTKDEVVAEWTVGPTHHQPHGIVHGGVYCGAVETVCSIGAALSAAEHGQIVVGVENHTSFIRAVRSGRLRCVAKPLQKGRRAHLWEANVYDEQGRLVATGRVRLFVLDPGQEPGR
jgi:1,4-dihydroxy-2-naphthoyl-CoA hydrolase